MTRIGRFITLEGGEGVGKSTQLRALAETLRRLRLEVLETREPGGSEGAEKIRSLLLDGREDWSARAEALLFAAARADHVEKIIRPALAAGKWVVSDRFIDSSLAYQGSAGGLGADVVRSLHQFATGNFMPDRTLVLLCEEGAARAQLRDNGSADRIGSRPAGYHALVEQAFRGIAAEEPERVRLVRGEGPQEEVARRVLEAIVDLLP